jgi:hypothetical protein
LYPMAVPSLESCGAKEPTSRQSVAPTMLLTESTIAWVVS